MMKFIRHKGFRHQYNTIQYNTNKLKAKDKKNFKNDKKCSKLHKKHLLYLQVND